MHGKMHGVVSLLDDEHYTQVEEVWRELSDNFGVRGIYVTPYPHFTYQVAEEYDVRAVGTILHDLAARMRPFRVRTAGLGIFTLSNPVLYIPVVRSPELNALHTEVWRAIAQTSASEVAAYYEPAQWVPHVTLAHGDINHEQLAEIVRLLSTRNFHWELTVNNLSLIYDTGTEQGLRCRFNFSNGKKAAP
jgi:2'-5' RNA ligase